MDELNFEMADILEVDSVSDMDELKCFVEWDSLAVLSLLAFIDKAYNIQLSNSDFVSVKTLGDIKKLIESKQ